ncbi:MAG: hypothetical protein Kow00108_07830 [Calditrichia bacterium]
MRKWSIFVFLALLISGIFGEQNERYTFPDAHIFIADNGLKVILVPNLSSPTVNIVTIIKTGLRNEDPKINGVSHMLEHMLFNGTSTLSQEELYATIDKNGFYINAQTSEDYTTFLGIGADYQFESLLKLLNEMLFHSTFPSENFEKEKGIILSEMEKEESKPDHEKNLKFRQWLYDTSIYQYPVLGSRQSIAGITRAQMVKYYKQYYCPDNMVLFIVGNVELNYAKRIINKSFGDIECTTEHIPKKKPNISSGVLSLKDNKFYKYFTKFPGVEPGDVLFPYLILFNETAFNNQSLWMKFLPDSLQSNILSFKPKFYYHPDFSYLTLECMMKDSISQEEYLKISQNALVKFLNELNQVNLSRWIKLYWINENLLFDKSMYFAFMKSQLLAIHDLHYYRNFLAFLSENQEELKTRFENYLNKIIADKPYSSNNFFKQYSKVDLGKYSEKKYHAENILCSVDQDPAFPDMVIEQIPGNSLFAMHILFKKRSILEKNQFGIAELFHRLLGKRTSHYSYGQIDSLIEEYGIEFKFHDNYYIPFDNYYYKSEWGYVRVLALNKYWKEAISLSAELIQRFVPDSGEFLKEKNRLLQYVSKQEKSPSNKLKYMFFNKLMPKRIGESVPPFGKSETISDISIQSLEEFSKVYSANQNLLISAVSGMETDSVINYIKDQFSHTIIDYPNTEMNYGLTDTLHSFRDSVKIEERVPNTHFYIAIPITENEIDDKREAYELWLNFLMERILFEIREKKGWAYRISGELIENDNSHFWVLSGAIRKGRFYPALDIIRSIVDSTLNNKTEPIALENTKAALIGKLVRRYSSNENLAFLLGYSFYEDPKLSHLNLKTLLRDKIQQYDIQNTINLKETVFKHLEIDKISYLYTY